LLETRPGAVHREDDEREMLRLQGHTNSHSEGPLDALNTNVAPSLSASKRVQNGTRRCERASTMKVFFSAGSVSCLLHCTLASTVLLASGGIESTTITRRWLPALHCHPALSPEGSSAGHPAALYQEPTEPSPPPHDPLLPSPPTTTDATPTRTTAHNMFARVDEGLSRARRPL
jgi:hypothetical protein